MRQLLLVILMPVMMLLPAFLISGQAAAVNNNDIFSDTCNAGAAGSGSAVCRSVHAQQDKNNQNPIIKIIKAAIEIMSYLVGIAAVIGLVVSGIRLMTAGGDSNAIASARSGLIYSLIGIAVVALAQALVIFVLGR
jgi:hypothetical protein